MNMDETACRLFYESKPGILATRAIAQSAAKGLVSQQVKKGNTRASLSLVALLCDDTSIQPKLPQFLIGNEHILPEPLAGQMRADGTLPSNVRVWRHKSAWVNDDKLADIALHWARALAEFRDSHQPILLLDACPAHLGQRFLMACRRYNIWVLFVPARMTWLLQPADTHCFAMLKRLIRREYHLELICSSSGIVNVRRILEIILQGIRQVMQGHKWAPAFAGNGWQYKQPHLRQKILRMLEWDTNPQIPDTLPDYTAMRSVFQVNREIPLDLLLGVHRPSSSRRELSPPPMPPPLGEPIAPGGVWQGRLRSSSTLHLEPTAAVSTRVEVSASASSSSTDAPSIPCRPSESPAEVPLAPLPRRRIVPVGRRMPAPKRARALADSAS